LGQALVRGLEKDNWDVAKTSRPDARAFDAGTMAAFLDDVEPDVVFNTWAYTQVDKAEDEPVDARRINVVLPATSTSWIVLLAMSASTPIWFHI